MKEFFYYINIIEVPSKIREIERNMNSDDNSFVKSVRIEMHDMVHEDHIELFVYGLKKEIDKVFQFLSDKNIKFKKKNITKKVLNQKIKFEDDHFENLSINYINENLSVDMILDKIGKKGIESLTKIDKDILRSFS